MSSTLLVWALAAYPARLGWGEVAVVYSATAAALCLVPTLVTLLWAGWAHRQSAEQQLLVTLGGTGVRMGVVLGVGLVLHFTVPYFGQPSFWIWLLAFYLYTLAVEMVLVVKSQTAADHRQETTPARPRS